MVALVLQVLILAHQLHTLVVAEVDLITLRIPLVLVAQGVEVMVANTIQTQPRVLQTLAVAVVVQVDSLRQNLVLLVVLA
jgi:hypothetical protein